MCLKAEEIESPKRACLGVGPSWTPRSTPLPLFLGGVKLNGLSVEGSARGDVKGVETTEESDVLLEDEADVWMSVSTSAKG